MLPPVSPLREETAPELPSIGPDDAFVKVVKSLSKYADFVSSSVKR